MPQGRGTGILPVKLHGQDGHGTSSIAGTRSRARWRDKPAVTMPRGPHSPASLSVVGARGIRGFTRQNSRWRAIAAGATVRTRPAAGAAGPNKRRGTGILPVLLHGQDGHGTRASRSAAFLTASAQMPRATRTGPRYSLR
jgi:hypothetical protein